MPPTSRPTRPPSPTNSPTTSQEPGACACDKHTIKDPNCLNCANDPYGCLGCKACGVEDCRSSPFSPFFSGFVGLPNTLKSLVEVSIDKIYSSLVFRDDSKELLFELLAFIMFRQVLWQPHIQVPHGDHLPLPGPLPPLVVNTRASGDGRRHRHHDRSPAVR